MVVRSREVEARLLVHGRGRRDVEQDRLLDCGGVVDHQLVRDSRASVVRADEEAVETERIHDCEAVACHGGFGIEGVGRGGWWFGGGAVAAEVEEDDRVG